MRNALYILSLTCLFLTCAFFQTTHAASVKDPGKIIEEAWDYMRGKTSVSVCSMTIHRPDWERENTIKAWTKGMERSIFHITAPAKDKGNGTLKKGREMWTFNPKINRVIKIPPSMMSQAWMGSDFSNNDLAKSDSILNDYVHKIIATEENGGKKVYVIEAMPKPQAPVVWGKLQLKIREDFIMLEEIFFDEDMQPVKILSCENIQPMGGRDFPKTWTMRKSDTKNEYTRLSYQEIEFDVTLRDNKFTLDALKRPTR